jgi:hypothetical protein
MGIKAFASEDYCAVKVVIWDNPANGIPVELIGPEGKVVSQTLTRYGEADFCDFGFGRHSIVVAPNSCLPVMLQNIRLRFETQILHVTLNPCPHYQGTQGCEIHFRISAISGKPLPSASIDVVGLSDPFIADRYGRARAGLLPGSTGTFTISARGYQTQTLKLTCRNSVEIDQSVVLRELE